MPTVAEMNAAIVAAMAELALQGATPEQLQAAGEAWHDPDALLGEMRSPGDLTEASASLWTRHPDDILEAGFTGMVTDKLGRKRYYVDGKQVKAAQYEAGNATGPKQAAPTPAPPVLSDGLPVAGSKIEVISQESPAGVGVKIVRDSEGRTWWMSRESRPERFATNEAMSRAYALLGVAAPEARHRQTSDGKWVEYQKPIEGQSLKDWAKGKTADELAGMRLKLREGVAADVLFATEEGQSLIGKDGRPVRMLDAWGLGEAGDTVDPERALEATGASRADLARQVQALNAKRDKLFDGLAVPVRIRLESRLDDLVARFGRPPGESIEDKTKQAKARAKANPALPTPTRGYLSDPDQRDAVRTYTGGSYSKLNGRLREGKPLPASLQSTHDRLQDAFRETQPLGPPPKTVFRGIKMPYREDTADFIAKAKAAQSGGELMVLDGYQSTSTDPGVAKGFGSGIVMRINTSGRGLDVRPVSAHGKEDELLLNHRSGFRVVRVQQNVNGGWELDLEHVDPPPEPGGAKPQDLRESASPPAFAQAQTSDAHDDRFVDQGFFGEFMSEAAWAKGEHVAGRVPKPRR